MAMKRYTRDIILNAAYELSLEIGMDALSMRKIAKRVGCSVMPLYENFESKEELISAVSTFNEQVYNFKSETMYDRYHKLLRDGLKYPKFFSSILKHDVNNPHQEEVITNLCDLLRKDERLKNMSNRDVYVLNSRIEIFIIGMVFTYQQVEHHQNYYTTFIKQLDEMIEIIVEAYKK